MKKIVTIALIIFVLIVGGIFASGFIFNSENNNSNSQNNTIAPPANQENKISTNDNNSSNQAVSYDLAEVAKHNTNTDCWMIIDGKVYDFTDYLNQHPDGPQSMIKYCGKDGTEAYVTKDKKRAQDHSAQAYAMLDDYYKGDLR
ncbi:MAG: cytochrome b5 domain-containing protein [Patescibacteria group bacterium]